MFSAKHCDTSNFLFLAADYVDRPQPTPCSVNKPTGGQKKRAHAWQEAKMCIAILQWVVFRLRVPC